MSKYKIAIILFFLPVLVFAQENADRISDATTIVPNAGHYVVALIAGVILAVAFQLILTNLSVAAGLNVLSTVTSTKKNNKNVHNVNANVNSNNDITVGETARTISSAFGIWALLTASIALFFASWLASELSLTSNGTVGAVLGLVIWGLFYVAMMTIEVSAVSSLVGSLVRLAGTGLRSAYNMTSSIFSKSEETKMVDTATKVASAVREEIFGNIDTDDIKKQIQNYINQLKPQKIDPHQIAVEFAKLLDETEIKAISSHNGPFIDSETIVAKLKTSGFTESTAKTIASGLTDAFSKYKQESTTDKDKVSKVTDSAMRMAGVPSEQAEMYRKQIEDYLISTGKDELHPDAIKRDLERLISDPKDAVNSLKNRLSHIDRDTITTIIAKRQDISKEEANGIVDKVFSVVSSFTSSASDAKEGIMQKFQNYLSSMKTSDDDSITSDIQKLFSDPKAGADSLMTRIKSIDRDTLKSMIARRKDISEEDAERIIMRIEGVRDNMLHKVDQMKYEINRRMEDAKNEAIHQADEVRKTASTAAWWAFATAVVSGISAAIGGMIGV